ncbi:MAG: MalY/PatB family protein [Candidatus Tectimicrobiota bacterium]
MTYDFDHPVERRASDSSKWRKYGADVLPLWVADMDFVSPEPVIRALRARVEHGVFGYGIECDEFSETVVALLAQRYGWQVAPEALVLLPGVVPGFNLAGQAVTVPGDGMLLHTPVYPPILRAPSNLQVTRQGVGLVRQGDGAYEIDFDAFEAAITARTRMFLLCNPHNPVGRVFRQDELLRLADICLRHQLVICSDEIHCDLVFQGHTHCPIASLAPDIAAHTITLMAPSKTYNLAGLKCAFAVIPNPVLREKFLAVRRDLVQGLPNILGYLAALVAYREGQPWLEHVLRYLEENRNCVRDYVAMHMPRVSATTPEGTYLSWLDCRHAGIPQNDPYTFFLERARVALNNGADFGPGGGGFVRLNFGCTRATLLQALERMREALATLG